MNIDDRQTVEQRSRWLRQKAARLLALLSEFASCPTDNDARRTLVLESGSIVLAKQTAVDDVG
jgi:hypothetical protein